MPEAPGPIPTVSTSLPVSSKATTLFEVEVVSTWRNRLIGDAALAPEARLTWTNFDIVNPGEPLQSSGLLGPVRIISDN